MLLLKPASCVALRPAPKSVVRKSTICNFAPDPIPSAPATPAEEVKTPEWVPAQAGPILEFLESDSFNIKETRVYQQYLKKYIEDEWFAKSTGWNAIPETINGRAAMLGFVAAAGAELFGQGSVLTQLSKTGMPVFVLLAVVVAATIIPVYKGTEGQYLDSLRDTYTLPAGVFTEKNEKIHGRLAMLGFTSLILLELVFGRAIL